MDKSGSQGNLHLCTANLRDELLTQIGHYILNRFYLFVEQIVYR